jgi:hypothetical protein
LDWDFGAGLDLPPSILDHVGPAAGLEDFLAAADCGIDTLPLRRPDGEAASLQRSLAPRMGRLEIAHMF